MAIPTKNADLVGTVLGGRYRILKLLGEGAMGAVYLGEHVKIGRRDAIKVLRDGLASDPESIARFNRGARNVAAIHHPNVCTIYDYSDTDDGVQFLAMQFIPGDSLKDVMDREGRFPLSRAVEITRQAAEALQAAHDAGIVHRDLKPANIMISPAKDGGDIVTVVDFDIAKGSADGEESEVTRLGFVVGTPEYMSPEQLTGDRLDGRSDTYSLALVLFRMISGNLPFSAESTQDLMIQRLTGDPLRLDEVMPSGDAYRHLQPVLDRALARRAADRYASVAQFGRDLVAASAGGLSTPGGVSSLSATAAVPLTSYGQGAIPETRVSSPYSLPGAASGSPQTQTAPVGSSSGKGGRMALIAAGVGIVLAAGSVALVLRGGAEEGAPTATLAQEVEVEPRESSLPVDTYDVPVASGLTNNGVPAGGESPVRAAPAPADTRTPAPPAAGAVENAPAARVPAPAGIRLAADEINPALWRQFENLGPPTPSRGMLTAIRDTSDAVWSMAGVPNSDRAFSAYIAGSAWFALGNASQCVTWLERALQIRPDGPGYREMLDNCRRGGS
jgi:serine/threonine protein kinase